MVINSNTANILALRLKTDGSAVFGVSPLTVVSTTYTSDQSLKENIEDASLADCLNLLENLKIRTFKWKRDGKKALGVIAQEVQPFLPADGKFDLVSKSNYQPTENDKDQEILTVDYAKLSCVLWRVVQDQQQRLNYLEGRLSRIERSLGF